MSAPTFDIPGMGRMTAAEFAEAYNAGRVPAWLVAPGGRPLRAHEDGRTVVEVGSSIREQVDAWMRDVADPLDYIGAPPC